MSVLNKTTLAVCCALSLGFGASTQTLAAPVTHYSEIRLNSNEYIRLPGYVSDTTTDYSGGILEGGASGTRNFAYSNGSGGFLVKPETSSVYARADLASGELKASSSLGFGANLSGAAPGFGVRGSHASATASIADSFSFTSNSSPYIWNDGTQFIFSFAVSGEIDIPGVVQPPVDLLNQTTETFAMLRLNLYRPGGFEAIEEFQRFTFTDYNPAEIAEFNRLRAVVEDLSLGVKGWCLGENLRMAGFCDGGQIELGEEGATVNYAFNPGGDFEWILALDTQVRLDISYENLTSTVDFSHTIKTSFVAPDDATVHSASGVFPNTLPLAATQIPEPSVLLLVGAGLLGLGFGRRLTEQRG